MKQTYTVKWMHCTSCSQIISNQVGKLDGVDTCEVNFATSQAVLEYDPDKQSLASMNSSLADFGYTLHPMEHGSAGEGESWTDHTAHAQGVTKTQVKIIFVMVAIVFLMMGREVGARWNRWMMSETLEEFFHHLMPLFATYVFLGIDTRFIKAVGSYLKHGVGNMDSLIGIGSSVAFIYSFIVTAFDKVLEPYLDVSWNFYEWIIVVVGLSLVWRYIEHVQLAKNADAIKALMKIQAKDALVLRDGQEMRIPLDEVRIDEIVIIKPGETIPVDGIVHSGISEVNESMITGESIPVTKTVGERVIWGTMNINGLLHIQATTLGQASVLSKIINMVTQAQNLKPNIQKLADTIAWYFVPIVLILATVTFLTWLLLGKGFYEDYRIRWVIWFVAILSIACPCALGLATPLGIINGITRATKHGILVKNTDGLLSLKDIKTIVFDKTGTITTGKPTVVSTTVQEADKKFRDALQLLSSLEHASNHPIAHAIVTKAKEVWVEQLVVTEFTTLPGQWVKWKINRKMYYAGNEKYVKDVLSKKSIPEIDELTSKWQTPVILFTDKEIVSVFGVTDTIKPGMLETLRKLHLRGIKTVMCTGDHTTTARYIANQLGIDEVVAEVTPEGKADYITQLRKQSNQKVAMVWDGINDSVALSLADVSISMSDGSDVSIESSDLILLKGDLNKVLDAITISWSTNTLIRQNLFRAFSYNIIGIPLAGGWLFPWLGWQLSPVFAGVFMAASSLLVVLNSLRGR